eukprot:RCo042182
METPLDASSIAANPLLTAFHPSPSSSPNTSDAPVASSAMDLDDTAAPPDVISIAASPLPVSDPQPLSQNLPPSSPEPAAPAALYSSTWASLAGLVSRFTPGKRERPASPAREPTPPPAPASPPSPVSPPLSPAAVNLGGELLEAPQKSTADSATTLSAGAAPSTSAP